MNNLNSLKVSLPTIKFNLIKENILLDAMKKSNCQGIEEFSLDEDKVDEILGDDAFCGGILDDQIIEKIESYNDQNINFYFQNEQDFNCFIESIKEIEKTDFDINLIENKDWNEEWRKSYTDINIDNKVLIQPSWTKNDNNLNNQFEVIAKIYPGMGFGTGTHETTRLCISLFNLLDKNVKDNFKNILDFGSGSGILAIVSKLLCPQLTIDLYDIDLEANENSKLNLEINSIKTDFAISSNKDFFKSKYDLVFANILLPILDIEKECILDLMHENSIVIFSGILVDQVQELKNIYTCLEKTHDVICKMEKDWAALMYVPLRK